MKKQVKDCPLGSVIEVPGIGVGTLICRINGGKLVGGRYYCVGFGTYNPYVWPIATEDQSKFADKIPSFHEFTYGWWILGHDEVVVVSEPPPEPKTNPAPPPAKSEQLELPKPAHCSCARWSKYTGLRHECANCRGTSSLDRRLAAAGRLEEIALTLSGYGEVTACQELLDMAATIRTVGFE